MRFIFLLLIISCFYRSELMCSSYKPIDISKLPSGYSDSIKKKAKALERDEKIKEKADLDYVSAQIDKEMNTCRLHTQGNEKKAEAVLEINQLASLQKKSVLLKINLNKILN